MALEPSITLTGKNPYVTSYSAAAPNAPYLSAYFFGYCGFIAGAAPFRLADQYVNDEVIVGGRAINLAGPAPGGFTENYSCIDVSVTGRNVTANNQYLLVFSLRGIWPNTHVKFYPGWFGVPPLRTEPLPATPQNIALLVDCPGDGRNVWITAVLASPGGGVEGKMGFRGMSGYIL